MPKNLTKRLSDFTPNPSNPRFIKDDRFVKLVQSLQEFPEMMNLRPMVCHNGIIIGGNMRYRALTHLKYEEVPANWIMEANDLTEEQRKRFIMMDNTEFGEHDWDKLAKEWDTAQLIEWGMEIPDFGLKPVNFNATSSTGLKLKVTFESPAQANKIVAQLEKMGVKKFKLS